MVYDLINDLLPGLPFVLAFLDILIKIGYNTFFIGVDIIHFLITIIPYTHLHQFLQLAYLFQCIIHDRCMRVFEPFITVPKVAMRIYLQDTKITMLFSDRFKITKRGAMVSA